MERCNKCICSQCQNEFGKNPEKCKYSDCIWCKDEKTTYTESCSRYVTIGGKYDR